jgi:hypothetical protein
MIRHGKRSGEIPQPGAVPESPAGAGGICRPAQRLFLAVRSVARRPHKQLWQPRDVDGNPPSFVRGEHLRPTRLTLREVQEAARTVGLQIHHLNASTSNDIDAAFATFVRERPDALFVGADAFFSAPVACKLSPWPRARGFQRLCKSWLARCWGADELGESSWWHNRHRQCARGRC